MKTTLLIPVRNEIQSVPQMMPLIEKHARASVDEIFIIDGQSTDGTPEWFEKQGYKVYRQKSLGTAGIYWESLPLVQGDIVIPFSPDGNSVPEVIPTLVAKMREGYDMVIVSRYTGGARSEDDDRVTRFGNWMFTRMVNVAFGGAFTDTLVMFRAFRRDLPYRLGMTPLHLPVFEYELCINSAKTGARVTDIPGDEPKRIGDERKMKPLYNGSCLLLSFARALFCGRLEPVPVPWSESHEAPARPRLRLVK